MSKWIFLLAFVFVGCDHPPKFHTRWDGAPFEVGDVVYFQANHEQASPEQSGCIHKINGNKATVAFSVKKSDRAFFFGGSYITTKKREVALDDLVRKIVWKDGDSEPQRRNK